MVFILDHLTMADVNPSRFRKFWYEFETKVKIVYHLAYKAERDAVQFGPNVSQHCLVGDFKTLTFQPL